MQHCSDKEQGKEDLCVYKHENDNTVEKKLNTQIRLFKRGTKDY